MRRETMEVNDDKSDSETCLPPRKRLLAGLKKQNSSRDLCSSPFSSSSNDFDVRLRDILGFDPKSKGFTPEELFEASSTAALAAAQVAAKARAIATKKATKAANASVIAKKALELVASLSEKSNNGKQCEEVDTIQKHVTPKVLYKGQGHHESDEEMARRLHRAMNSSPRILRSSDQTNKECVINNKHRTFTSSRKSNIASRGMDCESNLMISIESKDSEGSRLLVDNLDNPENRSLQETINGHVQDHTDDGESSCDLKQDDQLTEIARSNGKKKARTKRKKLPLNLCNNRDKSKLVIPSPVETETICINKSVPSVEDSSSTEAASLWKHNEFIASQCCSGHKILQTSCSNTTVATGSMR